MNKTTTFLGKREPQIIWDHIRRVADDRHNLHTPLVKMPYNESGLVLRNNDSRFAKFLMDNNFMVDSNNCPVIKVSDYLPQAKIVNDNFNIMATANGITDTIIKLLKDDYDILADRHFLKNGIYHRHDTE